MFFEKEYDWSIIAPDVTAETLTDFCKDEELNLEVGTMNATDWAIFSQYWGKQNGLNLVERGSFAYMVSLFIAGMGVSCSTEYYLKEESIEYRILDELSDIKELKSNEMDQVKALFSYIFVLYKENLDPYWKKTERLDFRISFKQLEQFNKVDGKTKTDKLVLLLNAFFDQSD